MGFLGKKGRRKNSGEDPETLAATAPESQDKSPAQKSKKKVDWLSLIMILVMIVGACIIAYPTVSDWWNSYHQSQAIASYVSAVEETDPKLIEEMLEKAHAYNEALLSKHDRYRLSKEEKKEYESILDLTGDGVIGYIQINAIGVNLPIYHGISDTVLQVAIGHIEGTSLPVGGPSTHCAVSGHRGLPRARLFTDLDKLVEGDTFTVTVLAQTITYEIDQIRIVEPDDMSDLNIDLEEDYMTLITCTPYGINTHRLLVRGHRIANIDGKAVIPADAVQIPNYIAVPAVGLPMLFVYLIGALIYYRRKNKTFDREKVLEELGEMAAAKLATDAPEPASTSQDEEAPDA